MKALRQKQRQEMALQYDFLKGNRLAQIEAIAKHYSRFAHQAMSLLKLVEAFQFQPENQEVIKCMEFICQEIRRSHSHDFGLPLEWPNLD